MYKIVPNHIGPLVYMDDDNFLLDDILSKENYMEDDVFNEIIEHHLKIFTKNTMKIGWMEKPNQPKSTPKFTTMVNMVSMINYNWILCIIQMDFSKENY